VWFNEKMNHWNWVLIVEDDITGMPEMHSGNAVDKSQAKHDIMNTISWLQHNN
jgi:hypothetical protein